ncbi:AbiTii domain-containing protein [Pseudomonas sp. UBA4617]|uniref:AbiTii domain-containing protein n=1 Tax=Pseudomonas sp. UBA4617 TaxID=1947318 RepID=UPI0025D56B25|nr:hypothetical protein [Pseudomonas sp. UBA4617]
MSNNALGVALPLSEEILTDIELGRVSLTSIALKASRLARLLGDFEKQQIMLYEASGYPSSPNGIPSEVWSLAKIAGRVYQKKIEDEIKEFARTESLDQIALEIEAAREGVKAAADPDLSISSANPNQYVFNPTGNAKERKGYIDVITIKSKLLAERRAYVHNYVSGVFYELKFSAVPEDVFQRTRIRVDSKVGEIVPTAMKKFAAVYDNLLSENDEDWANAVHSCRRILQDTADALYPPTADKVIGEGKNQKTIKLGPDNYINRLVAYVEQNSHSARFNEIVGSHMSYLGERLDAIFQAAQKGSHHVIASQDEADRYVIYTYLVIGDILQLREDIKNAEAAEGGDD